MPNTPAAAKSPLRRAALCPLAAALLALAAATPFAQQPKDLRRQDSPLTRDPRRPSAYEYENESRNSQIGREVDIAIKQGNDAFDAGPARYEEAEQAYQHAAELNPKEARAYLGLGRVYAALNRVPETLAAFRKAVEIKPKMAEARFNLGQVLFVTGKRDEALEQYEALRKLDEKLAARFKEFMDKH
ncbi:MAG TPA: tetratricopeptide repeat protein [Pyrinomonadaceae bacterium]|nr:tetratricopeptide repeat protein [Pyrinomonadaceae bacterium]